MNILNFAIDKVMPKVINATRMLKEQLEEERIRVRISEGCLAELAQVASRAAVQASDKADSPYSVRLQRELQLVCHFIRQWTDSDESFDPEQFNELVSIARKFALPRPWKLNPTISLVRTVPPVREVSRDAPSFLTKPL
jgi:hypothetical protein